MRHHLLIWLDLKNVVEVVEDFGLSVLGAVDVIYQIIAELDDVIAEVNVAFDYRAVA